MPKIYHSGELAVQSKAGVQEMAARIGNSIRPQIPSAAQDFLSYQQIAVASSIDSEDRIWASLLTGEPGFLSAPNARTLVINATPLPADPLAQNIHADASIGLIIIEPATRRRMRVNGRIEAHQPGTLTVHTEQVYANCPKYIQKRRFAWEDQASDKEHTTARRGDLTDKQQAWIAAADTFFIATRHPTYGADASHRGGLPGFVHVESSDRLLFPDYAGNTMFQTLGNIEVNPRAGLLFIDFATGDTLQLTGKAHIIWDEQRAAAFEGAQRLVEFSIEEAIEITNETPLRGTLIEYSPFNP